MSDKWLIATNGTKYASEAVKYAAELHREMKEGPEVYLLVVAVDEDGEDEARGILELAKYKFEEVAGTKINLTAETATGEPGKVIVEKSRAIDAGHIFIGGADFKWDVNSGETGGISNYIIENAAGRITLIK